MVGNNSVNDIDRLGKKIYSTRPLPEPFRIAVEKAFEEITDSDLCWNFNKVRQRHTMGRVKDGKGPLWDQLYKALKPETARHIKMIRDQCTNNAHGGGAINMKSINKKINVVLAEYADKDAKVQAVDSPPKVVFNRISFAAALWHELGHALHGYPHQEKLWSFYEEGFKKEGRDPKWGKHGDPAIIFENNARAKLGENLRAMWYFGYTAEKKRKNEERKRQNEEERRQNEE